MYALTSSNKKHKPRGNQNPIFFYDEQVKVSRKQVELAFYIRQFRRIHNLSQPEMARLCSLYGKDSGVRFFPSEIHEYENYRHAPTPPKFQILMNTMDITPEML